MVGGPAVRMGVSSGGLGEERPLEHLHFVAGRAERHGESLDRLALGSRMLAGPLEEIVR